MKSASHLAQRMRRGLLAAAVLVLAIQSFVTVALVQMSGRAETAQIDAEALGAATAAIDARLRLAVPKGAPPDTEALSSLLTGAASIHALSPKLAETLDAELADLSAAIGSTETGARAALATAAEELGRGLMETHAAAHDIAQTWRDRIITLIVIDLATLALALGTLGLAHLRPMLRDVLHATRTLEETQEKLAHTALHDYLTGLPNRRYIEEHLRRTLAAAARSQKAVAVLHLDLDDFKQINDRHGHAVGDAALVAIGELMQATLRRSDFVGRMGGDEFIVIASELRNPRGLETLAQRLIERLGEPLSVQGETCRVGASIGIALSPPLEPDSERLLAQADDALYEAKAHGRAAYRFHADARAYLDLHYPAPHAPVMPERRTG